MDEDGIEPLTLGHFLIGRQVEAIPDALDTPNPPSLLKRWNMCNSLAKDPKTPEFE